ncbi:MAG: AI-2E family transporter [Methanotrichaceae archaeon]|nr:AI-2E family transporter [Methanotrichaceae archaeon]
MVPDNGFRVFVWISIILLALFAAYIARFIVGILMLSVLLAYMFYPVYSITYSRTKTKRISSLFAVSIIFIAVVLIIFTIYRTISIGLAGLSEEIDLAGNITASSFGASLGFIPNVLLPSRVEESKVMLQEGFLPLIASFILPAIVQRAVDTWIFPLLENGFLNFILNLPLLIVQMIIAIFFAYYLLLTGKDAAEITANLLSEQQRKMGHHFLNELDGVLKMLFTANFDTGVYNSIVALIIFHMLGVPFALIWAVSAAFLSVVRFLGPWLIFVPLSIYFFELNEFFKCFLILFFGVIFLEYIPEYILRPRLVGRIAPVNTMLAFIAYVAPLPVLGLLGIVVGPLVFGILIASHRTASHFRENKPISH